MPGISKLGPDECNKLETTDEYKSKSNLTEALKWPRGTVVPGRGFLSLATDHGEKGSHESDHDLAAMVRDFIENGSVGQDGNCHSSDSDSGSTSILKLGESIKALKNSMMPMESDLLYLISVVIASIKDSDFLCSRDGSCKGSCIRKLLVKHLKSYGYNAAVCRSKWKISDKVPGGEYEYVDVILEGDEKAPERLIIDIDFQSHFEIARPIVSYDTILKSLPVIYVGGLVKLERMLQLLVEAAKFSLKQNSMPIPPWRTLGYLRAKWFSPYDRVVVDTHSKLHRAGFNMEWRITDIHPKEGQCREQLRRLKASLPPEAESGRVLMTKSIERNRGILTDMKSNILKF
ncbi:uncharacterized protein LOC131034003 [Cryptomeria japonica]|uniref:uncharacterized protein LOC131034003 n=1 Tax=Cryptomeria japonica TaxID=3369 RepID=UPI0025ACA06B|nr:uncharacterized protein LOC131034003 [Cryptomeria japonica]XP_057821310.1 uncharacterized protein LOC131034003 [Cryptomeria japonica]XP_059072809.1 uncharacterized protein LOC131034003 [Cryptomeria japonica]